MARSRLFGDRPVGVVSLVDAPVSRFYAGEHRARGVDVRIGIDVDCIEGEGGSAVGVAMANAILLVTFAEQNRKSGSQSAAAARNAASERLRPVLMTSLAMITGMIPMALAIGRGSAETAPLGRAVIGGLFAATLATLLVLPTVFGSVQGKASLESASLDPEDPNSQFGRTPEAAR